MCTHGPANSIFSGSITHLLCVLREALSHTNAKGKNNKNEGFQILHFYSSFSSDCRGSERVEDGRYVEPRNTNYDRPAKIYQDHNVVYAK